MNRVLVVGIECVAGANLAVTLQDSHEVIGLSARSDVSIDGVRILPAPRCDQMAIQQALQSTQPDWVIFCGQAARSCWEPAARRSIDDEAAPLWAAATSESSISFTMLSSDAVFTGPWMSHQEEDEHFCPTPQAARIRQIETAVLAANDQALVVRTHVFGWSPVTADPGFAETALRTLESGHGENLDFLRHASLLLASDLAGLLVKTQEQDLCGLLHLSGTERVSPFRFAEMLAIESGAMLPEHPESRTLSERLQGFGCGETTLNSALGCALLGVRMPLLSESITAFVQQQSSGFLARLRGEQMALSRVA